MNECVRIAITAGEPAGIGPDLCAALKSKPGVELIIIADPELLQSRGSTLGIDASFNQFNESNACEQISVLPLNTNASVATGTLDPANSAYVLESIRIAVDGCRDGLFDAMVTPPVHKGVINDAGIAFSGHTEFIAERLNATPLMVLAAEKLKVALATTHLPLKEVANAITHDGIVNCLQILHDDLQSKYKISSHQQLKPRVPKALTQPDRCLQIHCSPTDTWKALMRYSRCFMIRDCQY